VEVIDGPTADSTGHDWYQIRNDRTGVTGWSAGDFLVEIDADETEQAAPVASNGRTMTVKTTGYYYGPGARTRMGTPVHWGEVAVDPSVIPLGSRIKIDGFDTIFTAEDTGGGVRGAWIDIFFPSYAEAIQWGVQYRTVTILN
jgi:3D (Asp-Asp-Asp) domain-containing protein